MKIDAILALPGNRPVYDELAQRIAAGDAIAFVGAGASAGLYPLWSEFVRHLAQQALNRKKATAEMARYWLHEPSLSPQQQVNSIVDKLGERAYREILRATFGARTGRDGKRYTRIHELLLSLPFRGYVTTNYDPALDYARMDVRPASRSTGTPTWQNDDVMMQWLTGDIFEARDVCPILWIHGYWQKPETIVLNAGEYASAYSRNVYKNTFRRLWQQDRLVFVGFGFGDPRFTFMVGDMLDEIRHVSAPRHIALIGVDAADSPTVIMERRKRLEFDYGVQPLFYRITKAPDQAQDHSELADVLASLTEISSPAERRPARANVHIARQRLPQYWVHETTNDEMFVARDDERRRLNRWVRDDIVRAIGICAVGGTGKTALVGHWLKNTDEWLTRSFDGLFAWSFYRDQDSAQFVKTLTNWAVRELGVRTNQHMPEVREAISLLRNRNLVIVLDGLEVLQEGPTDSHYGSFLEALLRDILTAVCSSKHGSLVILTSRFSFADLERFLGTSFHQLELTGLQEQHGSRHLADLGVSGPEDARRAVSEYLHGHPLALRVFAEALPDARRHTPYEFLLETFNAAKIDRNSALHTKLEHLLVFYEQKLPPAQVRLLSVVALFHAPVTAPIILQLARSLMIETGTLPLPSDRSLTDDLNHLVSRGILMQEPAAFGHGYIAHPILREYFRGAFLRAGTRASTLAADFLTGQPAKQVDANFLDLLIAAMDVLVGTGNFRQANDLYRERLRNGKLFLSLALPMSGLRAALVFVKDDERRQLCQQTLSPVRLAYFLNEVGYFAALTGQYDLAARFYADSNKVEADRVGPYDLPAGLQIGWRNEAHVLVCIGKLTDALELASASETGGRRWTWSQSLSEPSYDELRSHGYVLMGWIRVLRGDVREGMVDFARAHIYGGDRGNVGDSIDDDRAVRWCEALVRCGLTRVARECAGVRLERRPLFDTRVRYQWVQALCAIAENEPEKAEEILRSAEDACRSAQLLFDLARVLVAAGFAALATNDLSAALHRAGDALTLAQPRNIRIVHADALVLRGRARLQSAHKDDRLASALDDAEEALRVARGCGYVWAERDALSLQADIYSRLADRDKHFNQLAARCRTESDMLSSRLRLLPIDLRDAEANARRAAR